MSDGFSHLMEFKAGSTAVGENGSELKLTQPGMVHLSAKVAAMLPQNQTAARPTVWHIERARIAGTREVPVELIVNGISVARKNIVADGKTRDIEFDAKIDKSSWVALRIIASSHTNPVFVLVNDKPIRASKKSAEWCLKGVDQCWASKERTYAAAEHEDAVKAYEHAREAYKKLGGECED